jgi:Na/Pi-cotransporter
MMSVLGGLFGGIGLFLLGMWLMTEGLKLAAGPALERILARSTGTRLRGLASGALVTAVVQSSSAVIVATIGFVNAGLLTLGQALWVLFGANVGTTMTGWLVAVAGLDFKIEALALPLIGVGMLLHLTGQHSRRGPIGMTVAGFGTLFLGIDVLRETFSGMGSEMGLPNIDNRVLSVLAHVAAGMALTVLMQSSSAALAVALTAAQSGALPLTAAAAVVIGANLGTTVKALLAALGATANAKRAAMAHVVFNLLTGVVALLLLPWLLTGIVLLGAALDLDSAPAATLALFHTIFNVLGVALMWPLCRHWRSTRWCRNCGGWAGSPCAGHAGCGPWRRLERRCRCRSRRWWRSSMSPSPASSPNSIVSAWRSRAPSACPRCCVPDAITTRWSNWRTICPPCLIPEPSAPRPCASRSCSSWMRPRPRCRMRASRGASTRTIVSTRCSTSIARSRRKSWPRARAASSTSMTWSCACVASAGCAGWASRR